MNHHDTKTTTGLVVHTWSAADPRAVVLLQHGYTEYAERYVSDYNQLIPRLNERGYHVVAMDMEGHGRSPGTRGVVNVKKAVTGHLEVREKVASYELPIFLFGHSLGGLVTAGSVTAMSSHIHGVILTGPALPNPPVGLLRSAVNMVATLIPDVSVPLPRASMEGLSRIPQVREKVLADSRIPKRNIPFILAATALETAQDVKLGTMGWTVPTMIMHGTADTWTDPQGSHRLIEAVQSRDKTLRLFDDGRHELLNDLDQDIVLEEILDWLDRHV